jgi:hypothetical protein
VFGTVKFNWAGKEQFMLLSPIRSVVLRCQFLRNILLSVFPVLAALSVGPSAQGAQLTLVTSAPPGSSLVISPSKAQAQLLVSVVNSTASDPPAEFMTGWQFRLVVVPDAAAFGSLQFNVGAKPSPYVFDSVGNLGAPSATVNGVFSALDTAIPTNMGVQIPTFPGANLQLISFTPSTDAIGDFGIYAEGSSDTFWTDENGSARPFVNVPSSPAMVRIADVFVNPAGDFNRDGHVNAGDIFPMEQALANLSAYKATYAPGLAASQLALIDDVNGDGKFTNSDLQFLLTTLKNGGGSADAIPEPAAFTLFAVALPCVAWSIYRRKRAPRCRHTYCTLSACK